MTTMTDDDRKMVEMMERLEELQRQQEEMLALLRSILAELEAGR